jgi:hypothetical protein
MRKATRGPHPGQKFWGCPQLPPLPRSHPHRFLGFPFIVHIPLILEGIPLVSLDADYEATIYLSTRLIGFEWVSLRIDSQAGKNRNPAGYSSPTLKIFPNLQGYSRNPAGYSSPTLKIFSNLQG